MRILTALCAALLATTAHADPSLADLRGRAEAEHTRAFHSKSDADWDAAERTYREILARAPDDTDERYYFAELLYARGRFAEAAPEYRRSAAIPGGHHHDEAAYAFVIATKNAVAPGPRCAAARCELTDGDRALAAAYRFYLEQIADSPDRPAIAYREARLYYDAHRFDEAAPLFHAIVTSYPDHELAIYAAHLWLDCIGERGRRAAVARAVDELLASPVARDAKLRDELLDLRKKIRR